MKLEIKIDGFTKKLVYVSFSLADMEAQQQQPLRAKHSAPFFKHPRKFLRRGMDDGIKSHHPCHTTGFKRQMSEVGDMKFQGRVVMSRDLDHGGAEIRSAYVCALIPQKSRDLPGAASNFQDRTFRLFRKGVK